MGEFDGFFGVHAAPIWNYLRRLTGDRERAADLFQRIFLKAWTPFFGLLRKEKAPPVSQRGLAFLEAGV